MADYKRMYLTALDAMERAMALLAEAERTCEEIYIQTSEEEHTPKLRLLSDEGQRRGGAIKKDRRKAVLLYGCHGGRSAPVDKRVGAGFYPARRIMQNRREGQSPSPTHGFTKVQTKIVSPSVTASP